MRLQAEERVSIDFRRVFGHRHPNDLDALIHVANQRRVSPGGRGFATHRVLRRMGFQAGVSDYFLALSIGGFHGLWFEAKKDDGPLDVRQLDFLSRMHLRGYACAVGWGSGAMLAIALRYRQQPASGDLVFADVVGVLPVDIETPELAEFRPLEALIAEQEVKMRTKRRRTKVGSRKWRAVKNVTAIALAVVVSVAAAGCERPLPEGCKPGDEVVCMGYDAVTGTCSGWRSCKYARP